jgi:hypothetical protein
LILFESIICLALKDIVCTTYLFEYKYTLRKSVRVFVRIQVQYRKSVKNVTFSRKKSSNIFAKNNKK